MNFMSQALKDEMAERLRFERDMYRRMHERFVEEVLAIREAAQRLNETSEAHNRLIAQNPSEHALGRSESRLTDERESFEAMIEDTLCVSAETLRKALAC